MVGPESHTTKIEVGPSHATPPSTCKGTRKSYYQRWFVGWPCGAEAYFSPPPRPPRLHRSKRPLRQLLRHLGGDVKATIHPSRRRRGSRRRRRRRRIPNEKHTYLRIHEAEGRSRSRSRIIIRRTIIRTRRRIRRNRRIVEVLVIRIIRTILVSNKKKMKQRKKKKKK